MPLGPDMVEGYLPRLVCADNLSTLKIWTLDSVSTVVMI